MANPEHVEIAKQGAEAIRQWQTKAKYHGLDLSNADLSGIDLSDAHLMQANLRESILANARLTRAKVFYANFYLADLKGSDLSDASFRFCRFERANLTASQLSGATFNNSRLNNADFSKCSCEFTTFVSVNLANAMGLEDVFHRFSSSIGFDTVIASHGKIPEMFLRGCGLPEQIIAMIPSLVGSLDPIQFYSCFISYSHKDEPFAQRLHASLQQKGLRVWYAPENMQMGQKLHEQIESAICVHDKLLLVLSEASMNSEWVKSEIAHARQREINEGRRVLFPISLVPFDAIRAWKAFDADTGKDTAREIREFLIGDFSNWKDHDSFDKSFARLLRDLRAQGDKEIGA